VFAHQPADKGVITARRLWPTPCSSTTSQAKAASGAAGGRHPEIGSTWSFSAC
jgi:hypothetical protein